MLSNFYGQRIKENRKRLKMTVDQFAERLGVSRATQMNYEAGRTVPSIGYIDRCAEVGLDPMDLLQAGATEPASAARDEIEVELFRLFDSPPGPLDSPQGRARMFQALLRLLRRARQRSMREA